MKMKINSPLIRQFNPCRDRIDNFDKQYPNFNGTVVEFASLDEITYSDKVWVLTRLMSQKQKFHFALACATSVYKLYQAKYPNNPAVSNLLAYLNKIDDPASLTAEQLDALRIRRRAATDAAAAYATDATAYAAYAATDATAYAADAAAYAATDATAYAADAAADAAAAYATDATAYAADAARLTQQEYQLILMVSILEADYE